MFTCACRPRMHVHVDFACMYNYVDHTSIPRMLAELNCKVEASSREVGQLQAKLSDSHTQLMEEKVRRNKTHEDHLMGM